MRTDAAAGSGPLAPRPRPALLRGPQTWVLPLSRDSRDRVVPRGCGGCCRHRASRGDSGSVGAEDMPGDLLCCGRREPSRPPVPPVLRGLRRRCVPPAGTREVPGATVAGVLWSAQPWGAGMPSRWPGELTDADGGLCSWRARRCQVLEGREAADTPALNTTALSGPSPKPAPSHASGGEGFPVLELSPVGCSVHQATQS